MVFESDGASSLSDIYAVGVCLYQMISGRRPHESKELRKLLFMILNEPATPLEERLPDVPAAIAKIVGKALARHPEDRYSSAEEMGKSLRKYCESQGC